MVRKRIYVTLVYAVSASSSSFGCHEESDLPPIQVATDDFAYAAADEYQVCPGTVVYAEEWMRALADRLGIAATDILHTTYYFVDEDVLDRECGGASIHCARLKDSNRVEVFSSFVLNRHELVHALHLSSWPDRQPILEEGLAFTFDDGTPLPAYGVVTSELNAGIESSQRGGQVLLLGGFLVYWIVQQYGEEALLRFWQATTTPTTAADFRSVFEHEIGESLDAMLDDVDNVTCQIMTCAGEPRPWADGQWTTSSPQGCEDDSVVGVFGREFYSVVRFDLVEVTQAGSYDVVVGGEKTGEFATQIIPCEQPCPESLSFDVGETKTLQLVPGRYRVTTAQLAPDESTKTVEIRPSN